MSAQDQESALYTYARLSRRWPKSEPSPIQEVVGAFWGGRFHVLIRCESHEPGVLKLQLESWGTSQAVGPDHPRVVFSRSGKTPAADDQIRLFFFRKTHRRILRWATDGEKRVTDESWELRSVTKVATTQLGQRFGFIEPPASDDRENHGHAPRAATQPSTQPRRAEGRSTAAGDAALELLMQEWRTRGPQGPGLPAPSTSSTRARVSPPLAAKTLDSAPRTGVPQVRSTPHSRPAGGPHSTGRPDPRRFQALTHELHDLAAAENAPPPGPEDRLKQILENMGTLGNQVEDLSIQLDHRLRGVPGLAAGAKPPLAFPHPPAKPMTETAHGESAAPDHSVEPPGPGRPADTPPEVPALVDRTPMSEAEPEDRLADRVDVLNRLQVEALTEQRRVTGEWLRSLIDRRFGQLSRTLEERISGNARDITAAGVDEGERLQVRLSEHADELDRRMAEFGANLLEEIEAKVRTAATTMARPDPKSHLEALRQTQIAHDQLAEEVQALGERLDREGERFAQETLEDRTSLEAGLADRVNKVAHDLGGRADEAQRTTRDQLLALELALEKATEASQAAEERALQRIQRLERLLEESTAPHTPEAADPVHALEAEIDARLEARERHWIEELRAREDTLTAKVEASELHTQDCVGPLQTTVEQLAEEVRAISRAHDAQARAARERAQDVDHRIEERSRTLASNIELGEARLQKHLERSIHKLEQQMRESSEAWTRQLEEHQNRLADQATEALAQVDARTHQLTDELRSKIEEATKRLATELTELSPISQARLDSLLDGLSHRERDAEDTLHRLQAHVERQSQELSLTRATTELVHTLAPRIVELEDEIQRTRVETEGFQEELRTRIDACVLEALGDYAGLEVPRPPLEDPTASPPPNDLASLLESLSARLREAERLLESSSSTPNSGESSSSWTGDIVETE